MLGFTYLLRMNQLLRPHNKTTRSVHRDLDYAGQIAQKVSILQIFHKKLPCSWRRWKGQSMWNNSAPEQGKQQQQELTFLVIVKLDAQILFNVFIYFTVPYMFRACHAHHQEKQIVSIQLLVIVTPCWWQCRVLITYVWLLFIELNVGYDTLGTRQANELGRVFTTLQIVK